MSASSSEIKYSNKEISSAFVLKLSFFMLNSFSQIWFWEIWLDDTAWLKILGILRSRFWDCTGKEFKKTGLFVVLSGPGEFPLSKQTFMHLLRCLLSGPAHRRSNRAPLYMYSKSTDRTLVWLVGSNVVIYKVPPCSK